MKKQVVKIVAGTLTGMMLIMGMSYINTPAAPEITNTVIFEKILDVSDLSTISTTYNGVAKVTDPNNFQDVLYYISYEADVTAGIDFTQVEVVLLEDEKQLVVTLPPSKLIDTQVDITSLDYMFLNNKYNISGVSATAYQTCIDDMAVKSLSLSALRELASDNAVHVVEALTLPFLQQLGADYRLVIQ